MIRFPMLAFRSPLDLTHQLDAWIAEQPEPRPSRSEAIRFALRDWLASQSSAVAMAKALNFRR
jgi:Arc/MetJ-type ribon-helix-helix transcriptional regulator